MFGAFKRHRPLGPCRLVAYHATYAARVPDIARTGLKLGRSGEVWLSKSQRAAAIHAARRAAEEGCPHSPITVLKVRVIGSPTECPIYRPMSRFETVAYMTTRPIPPEQILQAFPASSSAVREGHDRARRGKRYRTNARVCPPPWGQFFHR